MFVGFLSSSLVAALKDHSHAGGVLLMPRKLFNAQKIIQCRKSIESMFYYFWCKGLVSVYRRKRVNLGCFFPDL